MGNREIERRAHLFRKKLNGRINRSSKIQIGLYLNAHEEKSFHVVFVFWWFLVSCLNIFFYFSLEIVVYLCLSLSLPRDNRSIMGAADTCFHMPCVMQNSSVQTDGGQLLYSTFRHLIDHSATSHTGTHQ